MNIPILGQTPPEGGYAGADDVTKTMDIHDTEILEIEKILNMLKARTAQGSIEYDSFQREIKERFYEIGFVVDVLWYETNMAEVKMPEIVIKGRTENKFVFDRDRQVHEVTNDILDLGTGGIIKADKAMMEALAKQSHNH
jgi:hypothetical protein